MREWYVWFVREGWLRCQALLDVRDSAEIPGLLDIIWRNNPYE
ncbi:hypothetical protein [Pasteuria penetrans]|nr:hypothetical protein [Pasteuria penetrans]